MKIRVLIWLSIFVVLISCQKEDSDNFQNISENTSEINPCDNSAIKAGYLIIENDVRYLYGGRDDWHFEADNFRLKTCNLRYGLGREKFDALRDPQYVNLEDEAYLYNDSDDFILLKTNERPLAYPLHLLMFHEVVNDEIDGKPLMIVFCHLADYAAVLDRKYCDKVFTFAPSGFTYHEENIWQGKDGFILWDRETESLWWPLIDEAVSGPMVDTRIKVHNSAKWNRTTLEYIKTNHPDALILKSGQTVTVPENWPVFENFNGC